MRWDNTRVLGPVDSAFYYVDRPETPMNIGAVTIYEGQIDYNALVQMIGERIYQAPIYLQKIVQAPLGIGNPTWVYDPDFYVENHVKQVEVAPPGDEAALRETVSHLVSGMLDRDKPLWEAYVINKLQGDRSALMFKVHHCMVDGLAAVELFTLLLDFTPEPGAPPKRPYYDPPPVPDDGQLIREAIQREIPNKFRVLGKVRRDLGIIGSVMGDKEKRRKALVGLANIVNDNLSPIKSLAINGRNTGKQTLAWAEFSLSEVRAIKSAQGTSVNDVMLTVLAGAVATYLEEYNLATPGQDFVRILVPVSMRIEQERGSFGNRISVLPVDAPLGSMPPLERLRKVHDYASMMKESSLSNSLDMLLTMPSLAPNPLQPLIWEIAPAAFGSIAHTWCTNVAGPQIPVYLLGHKMLHTFGFFPLNPSFGLCCVITSYNQRIAMTLVADTGIVPEVVEIRDNLLRSFKALRSAAKIKEMEPVSIGISPAPVESAPAAMTAPSSNGSSAANPPSVDESAANDAQTDDAEAITEGVVEAAATDPEPADRNVAPAPLPVTRHSAPAPLKLFSQPWAEALKDVINASEDYRKASTRWQAGPLALVMKAAPRYGFDESVAVLLDLHRGECRNAQSIAPDAAENDATFVIEGDYTSWQRVLKGEAQPLGMIMRGKLRLRKGSLGKLMPFTQSAQELIHCAQKVK